MCATYTGTSAAELREGKRRAAEREARIAAELEALATAPREGQLTAA